MRYKTLQRRAEYVGEKKKVEVRKKSTIEQSEERYKFKGKKLTMEIEEIKQRFVAKAGKLQRYEQRGVKIKQNQLLNNTKRSCTQS